MQRSFVRVSPTFILSTPNVSVTEEVDPHLLASHLLDQYDRFCTNTRSRGKAPVQPPHNQILPPHLLWNPRSRGSRGVCRSERDQLGSSCLNDHMPSLHLRHQCRVSKNLQCLTSRSLIVLWPHPLPHSQTHLPQEGNVWLLCNVSLERNCAPYVDIISTV